MMLYRDTLRLGWITCIWASLIWTTLSDCSFPQKTISNGQYVYQGSHPANQTDAPQGYLLRFRCSEGYTLRGPKASLCWLDRWTDKIPSCIRMDCGDPPTISGGHYDLKMGVTNLPTIGSTATYTCDVGFEMDNVTDPVLTCHLFTKINDAQWKGVIPSCEKKDSCPDPGESPDGTRKGDCCFIGDVVEFSCNENFELVGKNKIKCISGGKWTGRRPFCRPLGDHCEHPPPVPHGVAKGEKESDYYLPYDEVEVMCRLGYRYSKPSEFVMCEEENKWEDDFGECIEAFCDAPEPLINGTILDLESVNMTTFPYNFDLTYVCDKGFRLIGDSWRFCDQRGWSGKDPYCEVIRCPDPGVPEHGTRVGSSFEIGEKVRFKCSMGYKLIGDFERYCMPNGQWSGDLASCDDPNNYCSNPGIPVNGMKNSSSYEMGDRISFRCHPGFTLLGSETRECLPSRTWSGTEVKCMGPHDFDNTVKIGEILKVAVAEKEAEQKRKLEEYNKALYSTFHGSPALLTMGPTARKLELNYPGRLIFYFAFDVSGSVLLHNFRKSVDFAKAIIKRVGITQNGARAGALTFSSKAETQFLPLDFHTTEDVVNALDKLNYTGGGTSASSALTQIRTELIPLTQAVLSKKNQKSIIFILTDGKANMGGDPQEEAKILKKAGVEIYCIGITNTVMQDSLYKIASDPKEEHVFILQNYATLSYLIQEITNGSIDYTQCGLGLEKLGKQANRAKIAGGRKASEPWPWMAALYFKNVVSENSLQCGGSVINENFILTAAHCLFKKDLSQFEEKDVTVVLGITNVLNKTSMEEFEVLQIFTHPRYREGINLDYDIALLELKRPIEFKQSIRPVCLPPAELPPKATFYKPGENAIAAGWGHSGILESLENAFITTEDDLKEVILPIQSISRCNQSAIDHLSLFTNRMFCVGDGHGGNDTCRGDSGGPLIQSQLNDDGYRYWTQVGIVSWGIGCGLQNTYGYYTHVHKLRPWVMKIMESKNVVNDEIEK